MLALLGEGPLFLVFACPVLRDGFVDGVCVCEERAAIGVLHRVLPASTQTLLSCANPTSSVMLPLRYSERGKQRRRGGRRPGHSRQADAGPACGWVMAPGAEHVQGRRPVCRAGWWQMAVHKLLGCAPSRDVMADRGSWVAIASPRCDAEVPKSSGAEAC